QGIGQRLAQGVAQGMTMSAPTIKRSPTERLPSDTRPDEGLPQAFMVLREARLPVAFYRGRLSGGVLQLDFVSDRATGLTGRSAAELCGGDDPLGPLIHGDDLAAYRAGLARAESDGGATIEYRLQRPDG